jgi:hypothetical protein
MMENELVKANDVVAELDSVLELEDEVDSVPVEEPVLCCALALSTAKHCNHINERRMAIEMRDRCKVLGVLRSIVIVLHTTEEKVFEYTSP